MIRSTQGEINLFHTSRSGYEALRRDLLRRPECNNVNIIRSFEICLSIKSLLISSPFNFLSGYNKTVKNSIYKDVIFLFIPFITLSIPYTPIVIVWTAPPCTAVWRSHSFLLSLASSRSERSRIESHLLITISRCWLLCIDFLHFMECVFSEYEDRNVYCLWNYSSV